MNKAKEIYEKFQNGHDLSDADLEKGVDHFGQLSKLAQEAGPVFRLMANEARRVHDALNGFRIARRNKR